MSNLDKALEKLRNRGLKGKESLYDVIYALIDDVHGGTFRNLYEIEGELRDIVDVLDELD